MDIDINIDIDIDIDVPVNIDIVDPPRKLPTAACTAFAAWTAPACSLVVFDGFCGRARARPQKS